jgi:hypothetical protein
MKRRALLTTLFAGTFTGATRAVHAHEPVTASQRILAELTRIEANHRAGSYDHNTRVRERDGVYHWDCSAMAAFILRRAAPGALAAVGGSRPVAASFYRTIARTPAHRTVGGWRQVARIIDALPGNVLAWQRPPWFPSNNTGHVAFVVERPRLHPLGVLVRIADATRLAHGDDTRDTEHGQTGLGRGTLLVATNPLTGAGVGYGWFGAQTHPDWVIPTPVVIGCAMR